MLLINEWRRQNIKDSCCKDIGANNDLYSIIKQKAGQNQ
jgi:hypothetical protein